MEPKQKLSAFQIVLLTIGLGLGTFIQILDSSVANVSIPAISGSLGVSSNQGTWVITAFAVSNAIAIPLTGWLAGYIGQVRLFIWATLLFSITSALCGMAWSIEFLVFFRILQGITSGPLIPLSQALLLSYYPADKKGLALGLWSMIVIVAPILGPILGGWITDDYGWPWIFYINVPIGFFSSLLTWQVLRNLDTPTKKQPIDYIGLFLLVAFVSSLQIFLDKGEELDWWNSGFIRVMSYTFIFSFISFCIWNAYSKYPVIDFSFFKQTNFTCGTILSALSLVMFFGSAIVLPLWLQNHMDYTALAAGFALMPIGIVPMFLTPFIGRYLHKFDVRMLITLSFLIFAATYYWFSVLNTQASFMQIALPRFVQGFAVALFFIPLIQISLSDISNEKLSSASGLYNFIRLMAGGGVGTALSLTFWNRRHVSHRAQLIEKVTVFDENTFDIQYALQKFDFDQDQIYQFLEKMVVQQAYILSTNDFFILSGLLFIILIPFVWFLKVKKSTHVVLGE